MTIEIFDALGNRIDLINKGGMSAGDHKENLNTADYADGVYFVTISSGDAVITRRLIVAH